MGVFAGFVRGTRYTSIPNAVLGPLLTQIDTISELKCALRVLGMIYQRRGNRPWITLDEMLSDTVLLDGLVNQEGGPVEAIKQGMQKAVARGILLEIRDKEGRNRFLVNDEYGRNLAETLKTDYVITPPIEITDVEATTEARLNIFTLYEENIGLITPLLADELREAETTYPQVWVKDAFKEAVSLGHRNWRYISRILERWAKEGRGNGKSGRYSKTANSQEHLRRYGPLSRP